MTDLNKCKCIIAPIVRLINFKVMDGAKAVFLDEFKDIFDIDFNPNATRHVKSLTNMDVYEKIIVCTKFTDHKTHVKCKKHRGYTMTSGGFSSVKVLLGAMV